MVKQQEDNGYKRLKNFCITGFIIILNLFCFLYFFNKINIFLDYISISEPQKDTIEYFYNKNYNLIHAEDIWLIIIISVANFAITEKLKSFSFSKGIFGISFTEEIDRLEKKVNELESQLLTATILDGYEFCTLKRLETYHREKNFKFKKNFVYNFHSDLQLRHLYSIGFIEVDINEGGKSFKDFEKKKIFKAWMRSCQENQNIYEAKSISFKPEDYFTITHRGLDYLKLYKEADLKTPVIKQGTNDLYFE